MYDKEHGVYLSTRGIIHYPHRDAVPHASLPLRLSVPPSIKEQNEKAKECNAVWMQCHTAHKMGATFERFAIVDREVKEWIKEPKSFDETPLSVKRKLSITPVLRTLVKDSMTKTIEVPYLLDRRIGNGNSTDQ
jgi:hypothetical protein